MQRVVVGRSFGQTCDSDGKCNENTCKVGNRAFLSERPFYRTGHFGLAPGQAGSGDSESTPRPSAGLSSDAAA